MIKSRKKSNKARQPAPPKVAQQPEPPPPDPPSPQAAQSSDGVVVDPNDPNAVLDDKAAPQVRSLATPDVRVIMAVSENILAPPLCSRARCRTSH